jgi:hypothetical protein
MNVMCEPVTRSAVVRPDFFQAITLNPIQSKDLP